MINFEQNYPRSGSFTNPNSVADPEYRRRYKAMSRKCVFPAGYGNGLYHIAVGLIVAVPGFACMFFGASATTRLFGLIGGLVVGIAFAYFYCMFLQTHIIFPRGGSMPTWQRKLSLPTLIVPIIAFIGSSVWAYVTGNQAFYMVVGASAMALLNLVAYANTAKPMTLVISFILQAAPFFMITMGRFSADPVGGLLQVLPFEGLLFVMIGVFSTFSVLQVRPDRYNRDKVREYLGSSSANRKFMALCFLCNNVDANLLPEVAACCRNEDEMVAYTAQIALGNVWGPKPRELYISPHNMAANIPERVREQYEAQLVEQRKLIMDRWLKINEIVEGKIAEIAEAENEAMENIFALASGQGVLYEQARVVSLEMLGCMRTPRAYATLMNALQHRSKKVAQAAINGFFGADSKAVLYLEKFFVGQRSWIRRRAIAASRTMLDYLRIFDNDEADVAQALLAPDIDGLFGTDDTNTFAATISLLPAEEPEELDVLEAYFNNDRPIIKIEAMANVAKQRPDVAPGWVVPALSHSSAAVRYAAIHCVEKLQLSNCMELYTRMLHDRNPLVAARAERALTRMQSLAQPQNPWA